MCKYDIFVTFLNGDMPNLMMRSYVDDILFKRIDEKNWDQFGMKKEPDW